MAEQRAEEAGGQAGVLRAAPPPRPPNPGGSAPLATPGHSAKATAPSAPCSPQDWGAGGAAHAPNATHLGLRPAAPSWATGPLAHSPTGPLYAEWPVPPALAPYLVCAWRDPGAPGRGPVLPDACIDLLWDGAALHVAGPDTAPTPIAPGKQIVGLRFRPGVAPAFLGVAAHELRDRRVPLADLWDRAARDLAEQIAAAPPTAPLAPLERALLARLPALTPPDPLIADLCRDLAASPTRIARFAAHHAISERTLHRRALDALGYGPKTLARIVRFRRALGLGRAGLPLAQIAAAAGYADQAHLTRECRRLAGTTPAALFADPATIVSTGG